MVKADASLALQSLQLPERKKYYKKVKPSIAPTSCLTSM